VDGFLPNFDVIINCANFVAVSSGVSILYGVKIHHLPLTWPVVVNKVLALLHRWEKHGKKDETKRNHFI